jgi:hypothetical protein
VPTRIFFLDNEILIDTIPTPFVAGSLIAGMNGNDVQIGRVESDFVFTSIPWEDVAARDGTTFGNPDDAMAYVTSQLSMRRPVGGVSQFVAGMDLGGHKALMLAPDGTAIYADPSADDYVFAGVSLGAAAQGAQIGAMTSGLVSEPSWSWSALQPVYVASAGALSQTAPTTGLFHLLGFAATETSILVSPTPLVLLA